MMYTLCPSIIVSVLFSEPKIPQRARVSGAHPSAHVSVLFSEPKIPQSKVSPYTNDCPLSFSALQRAENSSIGGNHPLEVGDLGFQCSSASRKFLKALLLAANVRAPGFQCSSASRKFLNLALALTVERAADVSVLFSEPKIPQTENAPLFRTPIWFQCSSASRKFLNFFNLQPQRGE